MSGASVSCHNIKNHIIRTRIIMIHDKIYKIFILNAYFIRKKLYTRMWYERAYFLHKII